MKVLGITCARGGSIGVPRKNVRMLGGKPLIAWTIEQALQTTLLDEYVVSSDDEEILAVAKKYGAAKTIKRPKHLAQHDTPILDVLTHALDVMDNDFEIVADLRCTNPFKTALDIDMCIDKLVRNEATTDGVVGVSLLEDHHPARIKHIVGDRLADFWPEPTSGLRQDLKPKAYIRNGSIYVFWAELLRQGIYFIGPENIRPWIMPAERSINIDSEMDLMLAEAMLKRRE